MGTGSFRNFFKIIYTDIDCITLEAQRNRKQKQKASSFGDFALNIRRLGGLRT